MGDGADRRDVARRTALSALVRDARRRALGDRGGAVGAGLGGGAGPLRTVAAVRTRLRARSGVVRSERRDRRSGVGEPQERAGGVACGGRTLCGSIAAIAALSAGGRRGGMGGRPRRVASYRLLPR